ncbi:alcohol dehydrogenase [Ascobolus immersus RN42]|uniref:Alcohol dehydrogenase n=1 Tax=Ascobolus immersus RN42 TaxID=1160509 RepID=A0A3N4II54_ASCIM|nr:alcohol dehydrogenase [Ascobolus immersus RN42]
MSVPTTTDAWVVQSYDSPKDGQFKSLTLEKNIPIPELQDTQVLVKFEAATLNYRDLIIPMGLYPFPLSHKPTVPCSDGAGTVVAVGKGVTRFKKGDNVVTLFNQKHLYGALDKESCASGVGGVVDGTLRKYGAYSEEGLVKLPKNLDFGEGAALTCAGLTAWNALYGLRTLKAGDYVLVQGTGGVSTFALKFAKAAGAIVIATTSTAEKEAALKELGADHVINYNVNPAWGAEAKSLTPGQEGVDFVIEVGGPATLKQSLEAVRYDGIINVIGMVGGFSHPDAPQMLDILSKICTVRGIYVGSRQQMEEMCRAIEAQDIHPVMDKKKFEFEASRDAFKYQFDQKHFGNVVIEIQK